MGSRNGDYFFLFCLKRLLTLSWSSEPESVMGWHKIISVLERGSRNFKETSLWKEFSNPCVVVLPQTRTPCQGGNSSCTNAGGDNSSEQLLHITVLKTEPESARKKDR